MVTPHHVRFTPFQQLLSCKDLVRRFLKEGKVCVIIIRGLHAATIAKFFRDSYFDTSYITLVVFSIHSEVKITTTISLN